MESNLTHKMRVHAEQYHIEDHDASKWDVVIQTTDMFPRISDRQLAEVISFSHGMCKVEEATEIRESI